MLLATVGFIAGFVDTLAGGGGLITIRHFCSQSYLRDKHSQPINAKLSPELSRCL